MKTVVSLQDLVDNEIRPGALLEEFRTITRTSVADLLSGPRVEVPCPGCGATSGSPAFEKIGFAYQRCHACGSVFASPRPPAGALARYAASSPAAAFWRDRVLSDTLEARIEKLIRPRAEWVLDALTEYGEGGTSGVELSPQGALFAAELKTMSPALSAAAGDAHGEDWVRDGSADFVTAFDVLDRAADVAALTAAVHRTLKPGGLFFVTAPSMSGFDLQVLWDRSASILPPDKLNLLSIEGFSRLFAAPRWELIELSTPGMFDVENVRRAMKASPDADWPRGVREIVMQESAAARVEFQEYLQRHRLASFARIVVRRS
jgi:SAM-dependent methyltransferase